MNNLAKLILIMTILSSSTFAKVEGFSKTFYINNDFRQDYFIEQDGEQVRVNTGAHALKQFIKDRMNKFKNSTKSIAKYAHLPTEESNENLPSKDQYIDETSTFLANIAKAAEKCHQVDALSLLSFKEHESYFSHNTYNKFGSRWSAVGLTQMTTDGIQEVSEQTGIVYDSGVKKEAIYENLEAIGCIANLVGYDKMPEISRIWANDGNTYKLNTVTYVKKRLLEIIEDEFDLINSLEKPKSKPIHNVFLSKQDTSVQTAYMIGLSQSGDVTFHKDSFEDKKRRKLYWKSDALILKSLLLKDKFLSAIFGIIHFKTLLSVQCYNDKTGSCGRKKLSEEEGIDTIYINNYRLLLKKTLRAYNGDKNINQKYQREQRDVYSDKIVNIYYERIIKYLKENNEKHNDHEDGRLFPISTQEQIERRKNYFTCGISDC